MDTASFRKWLTRSEAMADPHAHHFEKDRSFWGSPMVFCLLGGEFFPGTTTAFGQNPAVRQIEPASVNGGQDRYRMRRRVSRLPGLTVGVVTDLV
jgi:hypothetical protein